MVMAERFGEVFGRKIVGVPIYDPNSGICYVANSQGVFMVDRKTIEPLD